MKEIENLKEELLRAQESTKRIEERIKELEKKNISRWRAEEGDEYYYIDGDGDIDVLEEYGTGTDDDIYELGNYFKTEEEAEDVAEKIKLYTKLKDLATRLNGGELIDWNDKSQTKYSIRMRGDSLFQDFNGKYRCIGQIYCLDSNFLSEAIEEIGEYELRRLF